VYTGSGSQKETINSNADVQKEKRQNIAANSKNEMFNEGENCADGGGNNEAFNGGG